jgi:hypothetical protein
MCRRRYGLGGVRRSNRTPYICILSTGKWYTCLYKQQRRPVISIFIYGFSLVGILVFPMV